MIFNEDCIEGAKKYLEDESIDLMICDPPFGINETSFHKHYKRDESFVLDGYVEAPSDYRKFSIDWLSEAKRVLKPNGSLYVISGWSHLRHILSAIEDVGFYTINHLIWKFNFGVATKNKYVSSHYHGLFLKKDEKVEHKFNLYCRFGSQEKSPQGRSLLYQDLEDVFVINKDYNPGEIKSKNKLSDALIEKLILYSSDPSDNVCDFFLGNFTTALVAKGLGRHPIGFEMNKASVDYYIPKLVEMEFGSRLKELAEVVNKPPANQGKRVTAEEREAIRQDYEVMLQAGRKKKDITKFLCDKYGRGRFAIKNILDKITEEEAKNDSRNGD